MTDFMTLVSTLREQMNATLSRSDVLKPLAWLIGILALLFLGLAWKATGWPVVLVAVFLCLMIFLYGFTYVYCLFIDRDALRSESYSIHKMAIQHGLYGDSGIGLIEPRPSTPNGTGVVVLSAPTTPTEQKS